MRHLRQNMIILVLAVALSLLSVSLLNAQSNAQAVRIVGAVDLMSIDSIRVNNREIDITEANINTQIVIDTIADVEALLTDDGRIIAQSVNAVDEDYESGEVILIGQIESFDGSTLVINGQEIDVSEASVEGDITFGGFVRVHATATDTAMWTAHRLESFLLDDSEDDPMSSDEIVIIGTLEEISNEEIVVAEQAISIEDAELIDSILVGLQVNVRARIEDDEWFALDVEYATGDSLDLMTNGNINDNQNVNTNDNTNSNDNTINAATSISEAEAIDITLSVYPNTSVIRIELLDKFGGLVLEVRTSHRVELNIDAESGAILTIEREDNFNSNTNFNANSNFNSNFNSNDNDDDDDNFNSNDNNDDDDNFNSNDND